MYRSPRVSSVLARNGLNRWFWVSDLCFGWQECLIRKGAIMAAGDFTLSICSPCFNLAPERFSDLELAC